MLEFLIALVCCGAMWLVLFMTVVVICCLITSARGNRGDYQIDPQ